MKKFVTYASWSTAEILFKRTSQVIITIIGMYLLSPAEFGSIAIVFFTVALGLSITDGGTRDYIFTKQSISKQQVGEISVTSFILGLTFCFTCGLVYVLLKNTVYHTNTLSFLLICVTVLSQAGSIAQLAYLQREGSYDQLAKISSLSWFMATLVSISALYFEFGKESLILHLAFGHLLNAVLILRTTRIFPRFYGYSKLISEVLAFSKFLIFSQLIDTIARNIFILVFPILYGLNTSGIFFIADKIKESFLNLLGAGIRYPILGTISEAIKRDKNSIFLILVKVSFYSITFVAIVWFFVFMVPEEILPTDYRSVKNIFLLLLIANVFIVLNNSVLDILKLIKYTNISFYLEIFKKTILFIMVYICTKLQEGELMTFLIGLISIMYINTVINVLVVMRVYRRHMKISESL